MKPELPDPFGIALYPPAKRKTHLLTREDLRLLKWAQGQAQEMFGAHTGGPNEKDFADNLRKLDNTMKKVRQIARTRPTP